ncbi:putative MFS family arabinose efflux permease [Brevibacterium sanguinis]|uniref:MFS family arabinose efflux permease n=2 Tax=Brevibacterium TaxID=1696 RepID=A0ABX9GL41_9MICO|nr:MULTISPECIES: MFS transporter [Brevibacterium]RBP62399.1 putative MFS family arabinose efflux permease [Brevibacterium sanguinis]RBP68788.1 putative MFS family arabinose efflux permease [Brevibacterium celere]
MSKTTGHAAGRRTFRRNQWALSLAQLFSGIGIATGFAVGGILAERLTGRTELAGFAQTASILGAGLLAVPLARVAVRRSRRLALSLGYGVALAGALLIVGAVTAGIDLLFFLGMGCFGAATAAGLQSRYAATDSAPDHLKGSAMSVVVWATTIGSVLGPNLSEPGARLGRALGIDPLSGPFIISTVVFACALLCVLCLRTLTAAPRADAAGAMGVLPPSPHRGGTWQAIRRSPGALRGLLAVVTGHMIMVSTMVMTPLHMDHHCLGLELIGITIGGHILGMYGLSPVFGLLTDRFSASAVIALGQGLFAISLVLGFIDALGESSFVRLSISLFILGLGWSACLIAGSTLLTAEIDEAHRVPVQGLSDAGMNLGAAGLAALAGPLLAAGGFAWITIVGVLVLVGAVLASLGAGRRSHHTADTAAMWNGARP